ncbi:aminotransferase class V-fold PLP-dependent enzyme [Aliiglaciecola sp. CAU 1673]|uniref:aminotransferase class V-fold PLP-dependent enzyme n=1 Tax=Aliiglaciecola sp. CAU 1673 TaxID=3032595 RepID=UPI0023DAEE1C|nr:aminotransferase class V-fold PLP-dependent enzyme [Aliiglaciecola sp. CAU 1673]MDF2180197.1 aminotransferase class V-fold PLP-dependent enzyme [Aliiglaciecola sp. CAU 1673]
MERRAFLTGTGLTLAASSLGLSALADDKQTDAYSGATALAPADWTGLRKQFSLTHDYVHLATFLLASHPKPVADAIEAHRRAFDRNPADYWHEHFMTIDAEICASAAKYMGGQGHQIALTDSTTMGLALVYSGLKLQPEEEILQTVHDHYSTDLSLKLRADRTGAKVKRIALYDDPASANVEEIVSRLKAGIQEKTKVVAVTWVHSSTGVKLPVRAMADAIQDINAKRSAQQQILFCVDGVHGFGIEDQDISQLGCDFFIAGTHKWIFGPRGTGVIWGTDKAWQQSNAVIPSFSQSYDVWLGNSTQEQVPIGEHMTPGGFHSFEHRWALPQAFYLHLQLGKAHVQQRIHQLNSQTKEGLAKMAHVKLYTPKSTSLSSGLVCFDVQGMKADEVVKALHQKGIIMSATPYRNSYARFAPSLINNEQEIDKALAAIAALA